MAIPKVFPIQARWFLLLLFLPWFWDPMQLAFDIYIVSKVANTYPNGIIPDYIFDFSYYFFNAARMIALAVLLALITRTSLLSFCSLFKSQMVMPSIEITAFTFVASGALIYLTFYPLAFVIPSFIEYWFINTPPIVYVTDGTLLFWPNILSFISLCVLTPITEELVFRGILLQRWGSKYNSKVAIILSSAIFASLHTDPLGAFLFGVLMCYLTICSKGILLPIFCHALYNASVWGISFTEHFFDPYFTYTLTDFKGDWLYGIAYVVITLVWGLRLQAKLPKMNTWKIPVLYR